MTRRRFALTPADSRKRWLAFAAAALAAVAAPDDADAAFSLGNGRRRAERIAFPVRELVGSVAAATLLRATDGWGALAADTRGRLAPIIRAAAEAADDALRRDGVETATAARRRTLGDD